MRKVDESPNPVRAGGPPPTPLDDALRERARAACYGIPYRVLAEITGYSEETIRRYMAGHKPAAAFLARICHAFELSPAWMLLGRDAPLERHASAGAADAPASLEAQLSALAAHVEALKREVDHVARPSDAPTRVGKRTRGVAHSEKLMKTQENRALRLVLGPADGQTVPVEQIEQIEHPLGDVIEIRLDAKHPRATLVEPGTTLEQAAKVYRYRRVMPHLYRWVDPVSEQD